VNASNLLLLLVLLACPVSMFFMHRGGHGHSHGSQDDSQNQATTQMPPPATGEATNGHNGCSHAGHSAASQHDHSKSGTAA
jgi:hypothetical protein